LDAPAFATLPRFTSCPQLLNRQWFLRAPRLSSKWELQTLARGQAKLSRPRTSAPLFTAADRR